MFTSTLSFNYTFKLIVSYPIRPSSTAMFFDAIIEKGDVAFKSLRHRYPIAVYFHIFLASLEYDFISKRSFLHSL